MAPTDIDLGQFCQRLPKVELHAHLNTSYSYKFLNDFIKRHCKGEEDLSQHLCIAQDSHIDESFSLFTRIQQFFKTDKAIYELTYNVIKEFSEDNVKYLELRSTPKDIPETGMTRLLYMQTMIKAVQDCKKDGLDITVRLLVSIDRRHGVEIAKLNVELADSLKKSTDGLVLGIDFSGDPKVGDATEFIPVFLDAAKRGLKLALHLAEIPSHGETKDVIQACGGHSHMRIGHGTFLHRYETGMGHEDIEEMVMRWKIPIETCVTSNLRTMTVERPETHHFQYWRDKNHPVVICTDGKGVYCCTLSEEYVLVAKEFGMDKQELIDYAFSTIDCIFEEETVKSSLRENIIRFRKNEGI